MYIQASAFPASYKGTYLQLHSFNLPEFLTHFYLGLVTSLILKVFTLHMRVIPEISQNLPNTVCTFQQVNPKKLVFQQVKWKIPFISYKTEEMEALRSSCIAWQHK